MMREVKPSVRVMSGWQQQGWGDGRRMEGTLAPPQESGEKVSCVGKEACVLTRKRAGGPGGRVLRMRLGRPRATSFQQTVTLLSGPHWPRGVSGF